MNVWDFIQSKRYSFLKVAYVGGGHEDMLDINPERWFYLYPDVLEARVIFDVSVRA